MQIQKFIKYTSGGIMGSTHGLFKNDSVSRHTIIINKKKLASQSNPMNK